MTDKDVRFAMVAMEKIERDRISALSNAEARGEKKNAIEMAIAMKKDGVDINFIAKYTKLPIEEIRVI